MGARFWASEIQTMREPEGIGGAKWLSARLALPPPISDLWLGEVGIRVTDLKRSLEFYSKVLGLRELERGGDEDGTYVLLKNAWSGQRLELNWYAPDDPFAAPYVPGEALDHFEVRVKSVPEIL